MDPSRSPQREKEDVEDADQPQYTEEPTSFPPSASIRPHNTSGQNFRYPITPTTSPGFQQGPPYTSWPGQPDTDAQYQAHPMVAGHTYPQYLVHGSFQYDSPAFPTVPSQGHHGHHVPMMSYSPQAAHPMAAIRRSPTPQLLPGVSNIAEYPGPSKPFECSECGAAFDRSYRLTEHMNIHDNKKPHVCGGKCGEESCTAAFPSKEGLGSHTRKERVKCDVCKHLVHKKNMGRHRTHHCQGLYSASSS